MVLVHRQAHLDHGRDHLAADIHCAVDRGDREIAALGARAVAHVAAFIFAAAVGRQLDVVDPEGAGRIAILEADVVEHEEFGLRADEDGIADPGLLQIGFGAGRGGARVAAVKLAGRRLDDVAEQDQHRRRAERVDIGGVEIGLQDHVRLVDRLPAGDRASVEHEAVGELVLVDDPEHHRQMLPLALGIGESKIDPLDLLVLDLRKGKSFCDHFVLPVDGRLLPQPRRTAEPRGGPSTAG
jgi:hypothetical protein